MSQFTLDDLDTKAKLVIWDLDETFWAGTLSEEEVDVPEEHKEIVEELADRGIMSSICSKNTFEQAKERLQEEGIWDLFIFPKIAWKTKGPLVEAILEEAGLRAENTVFVDDNHMNLEEVKYYNDDITVVTPDQIERFLENQHFEGKDDSERSRLQHYKILENKTEDKTEYESNEQFLQDCDVKVQVLEDPIEHLDRIHELVNRTNQLNFTKNRMSKEDLRELMESVGVETSALRVTDEYGDYGIVGFVAMRGEEVIHFLFSCRLLDLEVEQWAYNHVGRPNFDVEGETAVDIGVRDDVPWIEKADETESTGSTEKTVSKVNCLIKGGCDLEQLAHYLRFQEIDVDTEFNRPVGNGLVSHEEHTSLLKAFDEGDIDVAEFPFLHEDAGMTAIFDGGHDVLVYSPLMDYTQAVYEDEAGHRVAFGDYALPITEPDNWERVRELYGEALSKEFLNSFAEDYTFVGPTTPEELRTNMEWIQSRLPEDTLLVVLTGAEVNVEHEWEKDRSERHHEMNEALLGFASDRENVEVLDVREHVTDTEAVTDSIRHYRRFVHQQLADDVADIIAERKIGKEATQSALDRLKIRADIVRRGLFDTLRALKP